MKKHNIKTGVILITSACFAYFSGGSLSYSIFYSIFALVIFALVQVLLQMFSMKFSLKINKENCTIGESIEIDCVISNFNIMPVSCVIVKNPEIFKAEATFLNFSYKKCFKRQVDFKVRGVYDIGNNEVFFADLFFLIKGKRKFTQCQLIKVYPRVYEINDATFTGKNIIQNLIKKLSISEDSNDIRDLRRYIIGDSLKKVHWKLSAKHNELYIKNFSETISKDIDIFLNMSLGESSYENIKLIEEKMIDFTVSMVNFLKNKRLQTNLYINNDKERYFNIKNRSDFQDLLEYFLDNKSLAKNKFSRFIESKVKSIKTGSWVGIITLKIEDEVINQITKLTNQGIKCSVFYCVDQENLKSINKDIEYIKCEQAMNSLTE